MRVPQIRMESVKGQIGMRTNPANLMMEQPQAVMEIRQPPAEMQIERTPSRLTIDQTKAWEEMNLKSLQKLIEDFAQEGRTKGLEGIGRRAEEGDELMRIEQGGNPISAIAKRNSEKPQPSLNIGFIPSHFSVKVNYTPSMLDIQLKQNRPEITVESKKPVVDYQPGNVDIYMEREPSLKIDFVDVGI